MLAILKTFSKFSDNNKGNLTKIKNFIYFAEEIIVGMLNALHSYKLCLVMDLFILGFNYYTGYIIIHTKYVDLLHQGSNLKIPLCKKRVNIYKTRNSVFLSSSAKAGI